MARDISNLSGDLRKALTKVQAESLISIQAELGDEQVSPRDTGRFRSSWFASIGSPSNAVAPEGADSSNTDAQGLKPKLTDAAWLSNNLPYAETVAVEGRTTSQPSTWFTDFRNQRVPKLMAEAAETVRREEGF